MSLLAAGSVDLSIDLSGWDTALLGIYFVFVIGIGFALKRLVHPLPTSSVRQVPAG